MQVKAGYGNRVIRSDLINPFFCGKLTAPELLIPVSAFNPFAFRQAFGPAGDNICKLLRGRSLAQVYLLERFGAHQKMGVVIYQTGCDKSPLKINDSGAFGF